MNEQINTKDRLIRAGVKLFAKYGYAATSTRMIASEAGVNLSAIAFHYTNKEKLYQACLEYMQEKSRHTTVLPAGRSRRRSLRER